MTRSARPVARRGARPAARAGLHLGRFRITPFRAVVSIGFVGSGAYIAWAILRVRDVSQIPMLSAGFGVLGLTFAAVSIAALVALWRAWRSDRAGRSALMAIIGGIAGLGAIGSWSLAVVLGLVWRA